MTLAVNEILQRNTSVDFVSLMSGGESFKELTESYWSLDKLSINYE